MTAFFMAYHPWRPPSGPSALLTDFLQRQRHLRRRHPLQIAQQLMGNLGNAVALAQQRRHKAGQVGRHLRIGQRAVRLQWLELP